MQGIPQFIDTDKKVAYLNTLLKVGFSVLDCGSFVSPKAIPQMADTAQVLPQLEHSDTELLVIVANTRGAEDAVKFPRVDWLGFPLSISETFQQRNTNKSIKEALQSLATIQSIAQQANKRVVCYLSMAFGNPYNDSYSPALIGEFSKKVTDLGITSISLADTIGSATTENIGTVYKAATESNPETKVGLHLHSRPEDVYRKTLAAWQAGCHWLDGAINGYGGCPMAKDDLTGNMATEEIVRALNDEQVATSINQEAFAQAISMAGQIFPNH
jgi:hydroxymethylglutaryl-CoA lyase